MTNKEKLLHHYFLDKLTLEERHLFDKFLKEDKDFKEQFEFEKNLKQAIKKKEKTALKHKLQEFEKDLQNSSRHNYFSWKPLSIAASIAIIFTIGWYIYTTSFAVNMEKLYATNYEKYTNTIYAITRGDTTNYSLEHKAFEAYETNDTMKSIQLFTELKKDKDLEYVDFYLAQSYLNSGQLKNAIILFTEVISNKEEFKAESLWYLSLTYLKAREKEKAKQRLNDLIQEGTFKKAEATLLLEKLH